MEEKGGRSMKIVVVGPESTGKSTLVEELASFYQVPFVDEYARQFIDELDRDYTQSDLAEIAKGQLKLESEVLSQNPKLMICDSDLLTIKIWSEYKYSTCDDFILKTYNQNLPDLYLLSYPDLPWVFDKQRENPNDREELYYIYEKEIQKVNVPYRIIKGTEEQRKINAIEVVNNFMFR